jgi:hypothetical protein
LVQGVNDLLGSADSERRDDHEPFAVESRPHKLADLFIRAVFKGMLATTVGALDLEIIHIIDRLRIAEDVVFAAADIAAEHVTEFPAVFPNIEDDLGGAENVSSIPKRDGHTVKHGKGAVVIDADKLTHGLFGIGWRVEGLNRRQAMLGTLFGDECGIVALNLRGIFQHDCREVARGESAVDITFVSLPAQVGQIAAVIDVRVAENDCIDLLGVEREFAIAFDLFLPFALEQAAFEKEAVAINLE